MAGRQAGKALQDEEKGGFLAPVLELNVSRLEHLRCCRETMDRIVDSIGVLELGDALSTDDQKELLVNVNKVQVAARNAGLSAYNDLLRLDSCLQTDPSGKEQHAAAALQILEEVDVPDLHAITALEATESGSDDSFTPADTTKRRKNDTGKDDTYTRADAFWNGVDDYFRFPTEEHIALMGKPTEIDHKLYTLPELGPHFSQAWLDADAAVESQLPPSHPIRKKKRTYGGLARQYRPKSDKMAVNDKLIKARIKEFDDALKPVHKNLGSHTVSQRLLGALIPATSFSRITVKSEKKDPVTSAAPVAEQVEGTVPYAMRPASMSFDDRVLQELEFIGMKCTSKVTQPEQRYDDAVCVELRKSQNKLESVTQHVQEVRSHILDKLDVLQEQEQLLQRLRDAESVYEDLMQRKLDSGSKVSKTQLERAYHNVAKAEEAVAAYTNLYGITATRNLMRTPL